MAPSMPGYRGRRERNQAKQPIGALVLRILTVALVLTSGLVALEIGLRIADRFGWIGLWRDLRQAREASIWTTSTDPRLIYRHRADYFKNSERYTEKHGILRPTDVETEPASGVFRIAVLGDSVAAALELPYEQRMFSLVEAMTLESPRLSPTEVLNFSVNGYGTSQQATLLETLVRDFEPDLLMLQFCMNDFHPTRFPAMWFFEYPRSYVLTLGRFALDRRLLDGYPRAEYWQKSFRDDRKGWESVVDGFGRISRYAKFRNIPALVIVFPLLSKNGWNEADAVGRHARVVELGRSLGLETLDLLPILSEYPVESLRRKPWDTFHLNAKGHRIAAIAITRALLELSDRTGGRDSGPASEVLE